MMLKNSNARWGLVIQGLHWLMFLLILGAWLAVEMHENFPKGSDERTELMLLHKSLGATIFFLVWARIGARLAMVTPRAIGKGALLKVSQVVGIGLYLLMILVPVSGMLLSQASGRAVAWFGLFELPVVLAENEALAERLEDLHEIGFNILLVLLALHVLGAIKHHVVDKDDTLRRMLPGGKKPVS